MIRKHQSIYLGEFWLYRSRMNAFIVEKLFDSFGDFHVVREIAAALHKYNV